MADTTIKIDEGIRDRLRTLAEERGMSTRAYVERMVAATPTAPEQAERTARAVAYVRAHFGVDLSDDDLRDARQWRADLLAHRLGERR
ncbi:hypothetical protein [Streptomyces niveus]